MFRSEHDVYLKEMISLHLDKMRTGYGSTVISKEAGYGSTVISKEAGYENTVISKEAAALHPEVSLYLVRIKTHFK